MTTYPMVGEGVTWTPVTGGSAAETKFTFERENNPLAVLPVRASCSNEVTKAGMARSLIKLEAYLDAALMGVNQGFTGLSAAYTKTLTPVSVHLVASAPRGAMQLAGSAEDALNGLVAFLLRNLMTIITDRSSDETSINEWPSEAIVDALKGLSLFDAISGVYGKPSA